jgi:hypothetical protein
MTPSGIEPATLNLLYSTSPNSSPNKNFQAKFVANPKHTFYVQLPFPHKSCPLGDNAEKHGATGRTTAPARCMMDNNGYKHIFRIRNTY